MRGPRLAERQLDIMRVLWARGAATVVDVHDAMRAHRLAQATIATLLQRMEKKGAVTHEKAGRQFVYRARITEEQARRSMLAEVGDRLFRDQVPALITYLISQKKIGARELAEVKALIEAKEREGKKR